MGHAAVAFSGLFKISFCVFRKRTFIAGAMRSCAALRARQSFHQVRSTAQLARVCCTHTPLFGQARLFCTTQPWQRIIAQKLFDVGEGTKEVSVTQWLVEEGAAVKEWDKLCEVQSDKASVDITSLYTGVIKKIHFKADDIIQTGDDILDIEVEGEEEEVAPAIEKDGTGAGAGAGAEEEVAHAEQMAEDGISQPSDGTETAPAPTSRREPGKHASLATPAVRGLLKEHNLNIEDIEGTGKDGRVLKEDVYNHLEGPKTAPNIPATEQAKPTIETKQVETTQRLTPIQTQMFKAMTASLKIPHFLYSDTANITQLSTMRRSLNIKRNPETTPKLSYLPFIVKAVSLALDKYPLLNARVDTASDKPQLIMRANHNIGIAMDTPSGLLVPVIKSVNARSILSIASEITRLGKLGQAGKLSNADLSGGTITVSNIGSIGGETVGPVIVEGQLAIMGVGKVKPVPIFAEDGETLIKAEMMGISWSADHRVVDGATMARMASVVQGYLEEPGTMIVDMS
jgi:2-oxoisovalerate dehydrogenase E2 component (dihydrolipoyl transacylase)